MTTQSATTNNSGWTTIKTSSDLVLRVRPEQVSDGPTLVALFSHLSPSSRFLRFSKVMDDPDPQRVQQEAERLAQLGPPTDMAWLAFADLPALNGAAAAAVRYVRTRQGEAELAVAVRDDMQQRGIGTALLLFACHQAKQDGIERLTATFRSENRGVWALFKRSPFPVSWEIDGPEISAVVDLTGPGE